MKNPLPCLVVLLLFGGAPLLAAGPAAEEDIAARMNRLEAETQALRQELQWLRQPPVRLPSVEATPLSAPNEPAAPQADQGNYFTLPELQAEMKKLAWTKGDFKIVPYGWLWGNMVYSTQRTNPGSYTLFVQSQTTQPNENEFITDVRNTRLGFDVSGPQIPLFRCAQSGGKVEIDFQQSLLTTENRPTILLRHAYWEVKNEEFRLLFGQTWDVISPLNPGMLMYSVAWDAGNIGYRRAQLRAERYLAFSDVSLVTVQGSANQTFVEDPAAAVTRGETSNWPIMEMRVATTLGQRGPNCQPITFGVFGHIGEEQHDHLLAPISEERHRTWSVGADFRLPLSDRFGFQAEFFSGDNLGAFLGGIGQGNDPVTGNNIRSTGGWCEVWYDWTPRFHSHAGYSLDDPNDADLTTTGDKRYNQVYWANCSYDITKNFLAGLEVSSWRTLYVGQLPGDSVRTEFVMKYGF